MPTFNDISTTIILISSLITAIGIIANAVGKPVTFFKKRREREEQKEAASLSPPPYFTGTTHTEQSKWARDGRVPILFSHPRDVFPNLLALDPLSAFNPPALVSHL